MNEPGLYRLVFTSRKKEAETFKGWVFHEVLPAIRKTGAYTIPGVTPTPTFELFADIVRALDSLRADNAALAARVTALEAEKPSATVAALPPVSTTNAPLTEWIGNLALDLRASRETSRRYTVAEFIALQPPSGHGHLGRRLRAISGVPVNVGTGGYTATLHRGRTAKRRFYEIRLHLPLYARVLRRDH